MSRTPTPLNTALLEYMTRYATVEDEFLQQLLKQAQQAGLPDIAISPCQASLLQLLILLMQAQRVLEIGTLGGYSAIVMGRAMQQLGGGVLQTLEKNPQFASFAQQQIEQAGLQDIITVINQEALRYLEQQISMQWGMVDMVFIDADRKNAVAYIELTYQLLRPGGLLCMDNSFAHGAVADPSDTRGWVVGARHANELLLTDLRFTSSLLPLGDGMIMAYKH